jgi:16S rRNA (uracil1498-N3)-methyltransferase
MYQFFIENEQVRGNQVIITGADVNHIGNVLRMKPGDEIRVSTGAGQSYFCRITEITPDEVTAGVERIDEQGTELPSRIYLFQGLPKNDKMELIVQKAVELGAYEIIPVTMKNCVVKLDAKKAESKTSRWQAIAQSAAKQSKRTRIPQVHTPVTWKEAVAMAAELDLTLVPYENERGMEATRALIGGIAPGQSIGIMIGPEGGFAPEEIACVDEQNNMHRISLGRRILRTETAGLATLSMLVYELDV